MSLVYVLIYAIVRKYEILVGDAVLTILQSFILSHRGAINY
jgi:hypothetical protein